MTFAGQQPRDQAKTIVHAANVFVMPSTTVAEGFGLAQVEAMAQQNVMIGRVWPVMPTWTRITVGTQEEMARFQAAFKKVMGGAAG